MAVVVTGVDLDAVEEIIISRVKQLNDRRPVIIPDLKCRVFQD